MRPIKLLIAVLVLVVPALPATSAPQVQQLVFDKGWGEAGFTVARSDRGGVELVFSLPSLTLSPLTVSGEAFTQVSIPGAMLPTGPGMPNLPGAGRLVAVPNGAKIEVEVLQSRTRTLSGINVLPAARIPLETEPTPLPVKDPVIYSTNAVWPAQPVTMSTRRYLRGVETRMLGITPFGYNPVTGELTVYTDLRIRLTFSGGEGTVGTERLRSRHWDPILEKQLVNFDLLPEVDYSGRDYRGLDGVEYIIVVPDDPDFISWGQTLADFRQLQGISSQVFTVTEMGGNYAASIESFIDDAYNTWGTAPVAVLFLGDHAADGQPGGVVSPTHGYYVSDNVYADVDGDDLPDVVAGRITARNAAELAVMINKVLDYEQSPPTVPDFYNNPMVACGFQTERWFQICTEIVRGFWANELGKTPLRQYNVYSGSPDPGDPWSTNSNTWMLVEHFGTAGLNYIPDTQPAIDWNSGSAAGINAGINAGCFVLQHRDHGSETGWGEPDYGISDLSGIDNGDLLPWVFSINCLTGMFDMSGECFAEVFHRMEGGALGITAATDVSYSFVNDTYVFGSYDSMWPDFDPSYPTTGRDPGRDDLRPAFANASGKYFLEASNWPYNPSDKEITYYLFHAHADPFTTLYSEVPGSMSVTHGAALLSMVPFFTVTAPEGSLIALTRGGEILGTAEGTGAPVDVTVPGQLPGLPPVTVTVTKVNCYRYQADVEVIPPSGPYVAFSNWTIDDSGGNGNGLLDAGETVNLTVTLRNYGVEAATTVAAVLSSGDPLVTIHADSVSYGDIDPDASASGSGTYVVELDVTCPDGQALGFGVDVTADGGHQWASAFSLVGQSDPDVAVTPATLDPFCFEGVDTSVDLLVENLGTRELDGTFTAGAPWITVVPGSGQVAPGGSALVTVNCDATDLGAGIYSSEVILESNDPDEPTLAVPVTFTVQSSPILFYLNHRIDDDNLGESQGNGNGNPEANETIELQVSLVNRGTVTASGVTAVLMSDDPYIQLTDTVEEMPDIEPGSAGTSLDDFGFTVLGTCPAEHLLQLELALSANEGPKQWVDGFTCHITATLNAVTGQVTELGSGMPLPAAMVTLSGPGTDRSFGTNELGHYFAYGLASGSYTVMAGAAGYSDAVPLQVTLPPNAVADFALGASDIAVTPESFSVSLPPWSELQLPFRVDNLGDVTLDFEVQVDGAGVGIQEETLGSTYDSYSGGYRTRGNVYHVDSETLLREVRFMLNMTSATNLVHVVYEGDSLTGSYQRVFGVEVAEPGGGTAWYSSGPIELELEEGKYYFIGCAFDSSCTYYRGPGYPPYTTTFGTLQTGVVDDVYPPPDPYSQSDTGINAYHQMLVTGTGYWAEPDIQAGSVAPGGNQQLMVNFSSLDMAFGVHEAQFLLHTNDPDENPLAVPLTIEVFDGPVIAYQDHLVDDDSQGSSQGDGDGVPEAGESVEIPLTLVNNGAAAAQAVTATIEVNDCAWVTVTDDSETWNDIPAGGSAVSLDDFDLYISPSCPNGTTFTVELTIASQGVSGVWRGAFELTVEALSRIAGVVDDMSGGTGLEGAVVTYSGPSSGSVIAGQGGEYDIVGLEPGTYTLTASADGYLDSAPAEATLPPDAAVNFHLGRPNVVVTPTELQLMLYEETWEATALFIGNTGSVELSFQLQSDVGWISFQPASGQVAPGGSVEIQVIFAAGGLSTGTHQGTIQVLSDDPDSGVVTVPALMMAYRTLILTGPGPAQANPALVRTFRRTLNDWYEFSDEFTAYGADRYGVNVAAADIDGDLFDEILTGPGPGTAFGPLVRAFEMDGSPVDGGAAMVMAYGTLNYGVGVAGGDLDGDGRDEIITGPGPGAVFGPHARAFSYDPVARVVSPLPGVSFLAYNTNKFGLNVTAGDVDGDGFDEIITGPGPGGMFGPHLRGWNVDGAAAVVIPQINCFAYDAACRFGIRVACGDLDGDGRDEIVTGPGPDPAMGPRVCGWSYEEGTLAPMPSVDFFPYDQTTGYGVVVACGDLDDDGIDELITVPGPSEAFPCHVRGFNYDGVALTPMPRVNFIAYDPELVRQGGRLAAGNFGEE